LASLGVNEETVEAKKEEEVPEGGRVRASRRIAQIKIKEQAEKREMEEAMKIGEMSIKELQKKIRKSEKESRKVIFTLLLQARLSLPLFTIRFSFVYRPPNLTRRKTRNMYVFSKSSFV